MFIKIFGLEPLFLLLPLRQVADLGRPYPLRSATKVNGTMDTMMGGARYRQTGTAPKTSSTSADMTITHPLIYFIAELLRSAALGMTLLFFGSLVIISDPLQSILDTVRTMPFGTVEIVKFCWGI